jgi:hypothetical protein
MLKQGQLAALTVRNKIPAIYTLSEFAASGGLISYGATAGNGGQPARHRRPETDCGSYDESRVETR